MEAVTGRVFETTPGVLEGFGRCLLRGWVYPAIFAAPGEQTEGLLYRSVDQRSLQLLHRFEDDFYERCKVSVQTAGGERVVAFTYVLPDQARDLMTSEPWDRGRFEAEHLEGFLAACMAFYAIEAMRLESEEA